MLYKEMLNKMPKYESFKYWFRRCSYDLEKWQVIDLQGEDKVPVGVFQQSAIENNDTMRDDFEKFKSRLEYLVGIKTTTYIQDHFKYGHSLYDALLAGVILIRAEIPGNDPDTMMHIVNNALSWLQSTDFYTAPASTRYHECYECGLVVHHLNVYDRAMELLSVPKFQSISVDSAAIVALTHDWCKIGLYESYMRNVKDENGNWVQKQEFKYRDKQKGVPMGHGVSSMYLVNRCFRLSVDECVSIRWHMGWCRVADSDMNELQCANSNYPIVHLLQFADQLSIVDY